VIGRTTWRPTKSSADDRPLQAREREPTRRCVAGPARAPAEEAVTRAWKRACRRDRGARRELPRFDHVIGAPCSCPQPGESWVRPRAPFRFHAVRDRELRTAIEADGERSVAGSQLSAIRASGGGNRSRGARARFTAFWAGPAATAWLAAMAPSDQVEALQRPDGIGSARRCAQPGSAVLRDVGALPRVNLGNAGITPTRHAEGLRAREAASRRSDVVVENSHRACSSVRLATTSWRGIRPTR